MTARSDSRSTADIAFERYLRRPTRRRLARVVGLFHEHVWGVALRVAGNRADASDLCQDAFLALLQRPPEAGSVRSPAGYLAYRVVALAQRSARALRRRRAREVKAATDIRCEESPCDVDVDALRAALETLPERVQAAIELRHFAGCRVAEIAAALEVSERTVAADLERGRAALRSRLSQRVLGGLFVAPALDSTVIGSPPGHLLPDLRRLVRLAPASGFGPAKPLSGVVLSKKLVIGFAVVGVLFLIVAVGVELPRASREPLPTELATAGDRPSPPPLEPDASPPPARPATAASPSVPAKWSLSVRVLGPDGDPVREARVGVRGRTDEPASTDDAGEAVVSGLPPGRHVVEVRADGYARQGVATDLEEDGTEIEVALEPECFVDGRVTDHRGLPVEGCLVTLWRDLASEDAERFGESRVSDDNGSVSFRGLPSALFMVMAESEGRQTRIFPNPDSVRIDHGPGRSEFSFDHARRCVLDIVVYPEVHLTGVVLSAGAPVPDASVSLERHVGDESWTTLRGHSRDDGSYRVASCAPGRYTATVLAPAHKRLKREIEILESGSARVDFELEPGGILAGVLLSGGRPHPGTVVPFARSTDGTLRAVSASARTSAEGRFAFQPGPLSTGGVYVLRGVVGPMSSRSGEGASVCPLPGDVEVRLESGAGPSDVVVEAFRGDCELRGRAVAPDGSPVRGARFSTLTDVCGWKLETSPATTGEEGYFVQSDLPVGSVRLDIQSPGSRLEPRRIQVAFESPGASIDLGDIELELAGNRAIAVRIEYLDPEADPEPSSSIHVGLRRTDAPGKATARVIGGRAAFEGLHPGVYEIDVRFTAHLTPELEPVDVRERESAEVIVVADPGVTLRGELVLDKGFPVAGGALRFVSVWVDYVGGERMNGIARLDGTRYRIQGLWEGSVSRLTLLGWGKDGLVKAELGGFVIDADRPRLDLGFVHGEPVAAEVK